MELTQQILAATARERFAAAVTEHSHAMFRAARSVLSSDADAEDAVGEAILRAWQSWGALKAEGAARSWLVKIAVNCAYELHRKYGRVTAVEDLESMGGTTDADSVCLDLWDAVLRLSEDHRVVVTLFYYEDMTLAQIAKTLALPQGTVKSRLGRARESLKTMLREEA